MMKKLLHVSHQIPASLILVRASVPAFFLHPKIPERETIINNVILKLLYRLLRSRTKENYERKINYILETFRMGGRAQCAVSTGGHRSSTLVTQDCILRKPSKDETKIAFMKIKDNYIIKVI